jgi:formamidopyrimidine-DNA glycosylase
MPELPDVELFKRYLDRTSLRQTIQRVQVNDARILGDLPVERFAAVLAGNRLEASRRHGKHLLVRLAGSGWLTLHFGMTGGLGYFENLAADPPYDRIRLDFEGGRHLAYTNRRMLGRVGLADDADGFIEAEGLGPDALDPAFGDAAFAAALAGRRRDVKSILMDQARLHPKAPVEGLTKSQRAKLFRAIKDVLSTAIECSAGAEQFLDRLPKDYLLPQREPDGRCPRCSQPLATLKSSGRTSYYCPRCQPAPRR